LHLAEDRRCRCERRRGAIREIRGDLGSRPRRAGPVLTAVGRGQLVDLRLDGAARLGDEPLDRLGQLRRERDG
jgi:hypothetical protein